MSAVLDKAAAYRTACAEVQVLVGELSAAKATCDALERKHQTAVMLQTRLQRELLEEARS